MISIAQCVTTVAAVTTVITVANAAPVMNQQEECKGTFPYVNSTDTVWLPCEDHCPPSTVTDSQVFYCWRNCEVYLRCVSRISSDGDKVILSLQNRNENPLSCSWDTAFFHFPSSRLVSCQQICANQTLFCSRMCPDFNECKSHPRKVLSATSGNGNTMSTARPQSSTSITMRRADLNDKVITVDHQSSMSLSSTMRLTDYQAVTTSTPPSTTLVTENDNVAVLAVSVVFCCFLVVAALIVIAYVGWPRCHSSGIPDKRPVEETEAHCMPRRDSAVPVGQGMNRPTSTHHDDDNGVAPASLCMLHDDSPAAASVNQPLMASYSSNQARSSQTFEINLSSTDADPLMEDRSSDSTTPKR